MAPFRILLLGYLIVDVVMLVGALWLHGHLPDPIIFRGQESIAHSTFLLVSIGFPLAFDLFFLVLPATVHPLVKKDAFADLRATASVPVEEDSTFLAQRKDLYFRLFAILLGLGIAIKITFVIVIYEWYGTTIDGLPEISLGLLRWVLIIVWGALLPLILLLIRGNSGGQEEPS